MENSRLQKLKLQQQRIQRRQRTMSQSRPHGLTDRNPLMLKSPSVLKHTLSTEQFLLTSLGEGDNLRRVLCITAVSHLSGHRRRRCSSPSSSTASPPSCLLLPFDLHAAIFRHSPHVELPQGVEECGARHGPGDVGPSLEMQHVEDVPLHRLHHILLSRFLFLVFHGVVRHHAPFISPHPGQGAGWALRVGGGVSGHQWLVVWMDCQRKRCRLDFERRVRRRAAPLDLDQDQDGPAEQRSSQKQQSSAQLTVHL
ncbi:hypothetical protein INR49_029231 [Caranx melampygus]|nr:hypothetical protein INR49_029231 [Caranx melampygus]